MIIALFCPTGSRQTVCNNGNDHRPSEGHAGCPIATSSEEPAEDLTKEFEQTLERPSIACHKDPLLLILRALNPLRFVFLQRPLNPSGPPNSAKKPMAFNLKTQNLNRHSIPTSVLVQTLHNSSPQVHGPQ